MRLAWFISGCGFGAVASMFLTGVLFCREFERRGGYRGGPKPVAEYRRPPTGPAPGAKR